MSSTAWRWLGPSVVVFAGATFLTGCADAAPLGPDRQPALEAQPAAALATAPAGAVATRPAPDTHARTPDLGSCENLETPAGSTLAFRVFAKGVQLYHWDGTAWIFDGPLAELSADPDGNSAVGTHYSGPTWESMSGGKVVGTVLQRCTPDPDAIPWLLLGAVSTEGPGIFHRVTFIQRVNTVGGIAPSDPGSFPGEEVGVPYTTEYFFYR